MSSTATLASASGFKFLSLPGRLRLKIWERTFVPRMLHIKTDIIVVIPESDQNIRHYVQVTPTEKQPVALHVCHESRTFALQHYTLAFPSLIYHPHYRKPTATYFNPEIDIVHIIDPYGTIRKSLAQHATEMARKIKVLVIESYLPMLGKQLHERDLPDFENLEELVLMHHSEEANMVDGARREVEARIILHRVMLRMIQGVEWRTPVIRWIDSRTFKREWGDLGHRWDAPGNRPTAVSSQGVEHRGSDAYVGYHYHRFI